MQIIINSLIQGLLLSLISLGFSIVYNSTGIMFIAQGAMYALTPFLLLFFLNSGLGIIFSLTGAILAMVMLSMMIELLNHQPLYKKEASTQIHLISSLGIYIAIVQIIIMIWGNESKVLTEEIIEPYTFSNIILTTPQIVSAIASLVIIIIFFLWASRSYLGLKLRALQDNPIQLSLMGHNIKNLRLLAFALCGFFTATGSILSAYDIGFDPQTGLSIVLFAIVATVIGGKGSLFGTLIGSIVLGILRSQVVWYTNSNWQDAITFLILVIFLFFRPQGIMGKKGRIETA